MLFVLSLSRELKECNMSRGLLSASCFTRIPISSAESFLTLQFIFPARLNLRPLRSRTRRRRRNLHPREGPTHEKGASFNKSLSARREREREERPFILLCFRRRSRMRVALRKWLSIASKAICVRVRLIIDVTLQRHIIYVVGNTCGCINNDAKRLLNNLRREYVCRRNRF